MRNIAKIVRMVTVIMDEYRMELGSTDDLQFARNVNLNYVFAYRNNLPL